MNGRFDFWRGPRPFKPKRRVRSPYRLPVPCRVSSFGRAGGFQPPGGGIEARTLLQSCLRGVQQQHVGLQNRRTRCKAVRGRQLFCCASVDSDAGLSYRPEPGASPGRSSSTKEHSKLTRWKRRAEDAETLARYQPSAPDQTRGGVSVARGAHNAEDRGRRRRPQPVHLGLAEHSKAPGCNPGGPSAPRR